MVRKSSLLLDAWPRQNALDGKVPCYKQKTYLEQRILKMTAQLDKSFSKCLLSKAEITRFEKTSFKLTATEILKIKLQYLKIQIRYSRLKLNGQRCRFIKTHMVAHCLKEKALCNYVVRNKLEILISFTEWLQHKLYIFTTC